MVLINLLLKSSRKVFLFLWNISVSKSICCLLKTGVFSFSLNFKVLRGIKNDEFSFKRVYSVISGDLNVEYFVDKK